MSEELTALSAARLAEAIRRREVSPVEAAEAYLRRVGELNPRLNAVVTLAPDVLERAREAERALMRGAADGALHGVPLTVKDTFDVAGLRATAGSLVRAERVPAADAPAVALLRAAGAIILGKTNCAEMALDYTADNPLFGRTNNPYDPSRTPGGSSGGCASAVAAGLAAASLGSDLAGSVRIPAHFCGVVGLRPTTTTVARRGGHCPPVVGAHALGASFGPLARTVEDARLVYRATAVEGGWRFGAESGGGDWADGARLRGLRFYWYEDDGAVPVAQEVREAVRAAARALEEAGLNAVGERPPHVAGANELWLSLFSRETRRFLRAEYAGREERAGPTARAIIGRAEEAAAQTLDDFLAAWERRDRRRLELLERMRSTPLVVAPVGPVAAFRHGEARRVEVGGRSLNTFRAFGYAQAFNVYDLPAVSVPAGRTREGLPVGVQLVGRPFEEDLVLAAAAIVEQALGGWHPPQTLPNDRANQL